MTDSSLILHATRRRIDSKDADLSGSSFSDVNLAEAKFEDVNLAGARIHDANLSGVALSDCRIDGMTLEGVLVTDLLAAWRKAIE
jgi:uncharacterized protein YjbI with pentapeptide repeats